MKQLIAMWFLGLIAGWGISTLSYLNAKLKLIRKYNAELETLSKMIRKEKIYGRRNTKVRDSRETSKTRKS